MKPLYSNNLLLAKTGELTKVDLGEGYANKNALDGSGVELPVLPVFTSQDAWQTVGGPFNIGGYSRMTLLAKSDRTSKMRIQQGYMNGFTFVPLARSAELDLAANDPDDSLAVEVMGEWAVLQHYNNSGSDSTIEARVRGRVMS